MADETLETETNLDENTETASSAVDQNGSENGAKNEDGSEKSATPTLDDVIADAIKRNTASQAEKKDQVEGEKDSAVLKKNSTEQENAEKGETEKTVEKNEDGTDKVKEDEKPNEPVPYDRFAEVNTQKAELADWKQTNEPFVNAHRELIDHCQANNIAPEDYKYWMHVAAKFNTDPAGALKMLEPRLKHLQEFNGDVLPPDLQKEVDDGVMPLARAKQIARLESQTKFGQESQQRLAEQHRAAQLHKDTQEYTRQILSGVQSWCANKAKTDVEFTPKEKATDPDGKFEFAMEKLSNLVQKAGNKVKGLEDVVKLADEAYNSVQASFGKFTKKPTVNGGKLSSTRSNGTSVGPINSVDDAIARRAAKHGFTLPTKRS